ncbi:polyhydroxyalkanoic acid system family protein [Aurantiacibacter sediminis]|uniref:Polyhydroxyalkanoic acid system family protein n=1 Tax=Aurantiacibacter sediminis TaxID=2793064 RepID=A0ABS0N190_9SPHN|nr:polyhydroxyalkanoic acid system family protein [Aurantiacibacter sediminis]MBH5321727.1 polyhydroxyalkanoic acid system family protein [Aurantiacibacter sediminis]
MRVAIPHNLGREEVRRRLQANSHKIADNIPGGMAEVTTSWPTQDRLALSVSAIGQVLSGTIDIEDEQVLFEMTLPPALGFLKPIVEGAIADQGPRLLEPPKD